MATNEATSRILSVGETCGLIAAAHRASFLIDAAAYYGAVRESLLRARRSVVIVGWDIDSRTPLRPPEGEPDDGLPLELGAFLTELVGREPDLEIRLLLWDYAVIYALEREPLPRLSLDWSTPRQIRTCLDDALPLGASHHQKIVVVDSALAFCGGLDLAIRRWDTSEHRPDHPDRKDPAGTPYPPYHDVQMMVDGEAALQLSRIVEQRWQEASCEPGVECRPEGDPWPDSVEPDFTDVEIGIARTLPELLERQELREIESLYYRAIGAAERSIYIENQYLTVGAIADAIGERMRENTDLETVIVSPATPHGWLEAKAMGAGRDRFLARLEGFGVGDRLRFLYPAVTDKGGKRVPIMVHAKLLIVDDRFLTVGSANISNRSMGVDSECNLAIEASSREEREGIARFRNRLLAEHLGTTPDRVAERLSRDGSLTTAVDGLAGGRHTLSRLRSEGEYDDAMSEVLGPLADPERPDIAVVTGLDHFGARIRMPPAPRARQALLFLAAAGLLAAAWMLTPLREFAEPSRLRPLMESIRDTSWTPLLVLLLYLLAGLTMFPITVLITLTAVVFSPLVAIGYAMTGSLFSACATYAVGSALGRGILRRMIGTRINRVSQALGSRGVVTMIAVRVAPVAPFAVINMVAGASHIRFVDFVVGTAIGMVPGIVALAFVGQGLWMLVVDPTPRNLALLGGVVVLWFAIGLAAQTLIRRIRRKNGKRPSP